MVVVLNEHSGFGSANSAPTAAAVVKKYFELKRQDEVAKLNLPVYGPPPPPNMPVAEEGATPALAPRVAAQGRAHGA